MSIHYDTARGVIEVNASPQFRERAKAIEQARPGFLRTTMRSAEGDVRWLIKSVEGMSDHLLASIILDDAVGDYEFVYSSDAEEFDAQVEVWLEDLGTPEAQSAFRLAVTAALRRDRTVARRHVRAALRRAQPPPDDGART